MPDGEDYLRGMVCEVSAGCDELFVRLTGKL